MTSTDDPTITPDLRLRAAIALAHFQHSKPAPTRVETFIAPVPFAAPKTVEAAREAILELLVRLASGELSIEAFDAIVGGLKAYLGDKAAEQQKILDRLFEDAVRENEK
ncbi:MAG TPA: hypothetical protein VFE60_01960 [Roseiarcus sp.]|nr:hypothetical protein [Roseiarcus sp.]